MLKIGLSRNCPQKRIVPVVRKINTNLELGKIESRRLKIDLQIVRNVWLRIFQVTINNFLLKILTSECTCLLNTSCGHIFIVSHIIIFSSH